jgi:hypothetical protein
VCRGPYKSSWESESRVHHSCARSVIRARRSQCGVPQLALRAYTQMTAWRIEVAPFPGLLSVPTPQKLSSPSQSLYMDMGMVMMPKKGVPRGGVMDRKHGEHKREKARHCSRAAWTLGDRRRDMLQPHPAAAFLSPRAPGLRPACAGRSPRAGARAGAWAMNADMVFAT